MGTIYKKTCESGKIYYGSFSGIWEHRVWGGWSHCSCRDFINPTHKFIEIVIGDVKDLVAREMWYINNYECVNKKGKYIHLTRQEYDKQKYIETRETIFKRHKEKISCDHCGSIINHSNYSRHRRTKKCLEAQ